MIQFNHIFTIPALDARAFLRENLMEQQLFTLTRGLTGSARVEKMRDWKNLAHGVCTGVEGGGMSPRVFTPCEFIYELDV